jgi:Zn-dependent protease with chaperone function
LAKTDSLVVKEDDLIEIGRWKYPSQNVLQGQALIDKEWEVRASIQHELGHIKFRHLHYRSLWEIILPHYWLKAAAHAAYSRHCEWEADEFIPNNPKYLQGLIRGLQPYADCYEPKNELLETHPAPQSRIDRLKERVREYWADTWSVTRLKNYLTSKLMGSF